MKSACEILFILSGGWNSATCTWNKLFPRGALKNRWSEKLLKITCKHKKQSSGGVLQKDAHKNFAKLTEKPLYWSLFLIKLQFWGPARKLQHRCFPEKFANFKNNYFEEHLGTSASKHYLKRHSNTGTFLWILWIIQQHLLNLNF